MTLGPEAASTRSIVGRLTGAVFCLLLLASVLPACAAAATLIAGAGVGAGQVRNPASAVVDRADHILYVGDQANDRVDEFDLEKPSSEAFLRAFGWGVVDGAAELQSCTAATACLQGTAGPGAGEIVPGGIAVDPSTHDVYVSDYGDYRVEEFTPAGEFLLTFGHEVDKTTHGDVCTAASHDTCGAGVTGSGPGAFGHTGLLPFMPLAFDPAGHIWVGDVDRVEEFGATGAFLSEVALPGEGSISALAIDGAGDFYTLSDYAYALSEGLRVPQVRRYDAAGSPLDFPALATNVLDEGGYPLALALDGSGHVYIGDHPAAGGPYRLLEFDAQTGVQLEAFGAGEVIGRPGNFKLGGSIALDAASDLYTASSVSTESAVQAFAPPPPGPLARDLLASAVHGTTATLEATLDPEGAEAHYRFQYLTQARFEADGGQFGAGTEETPEATLAAGFSETAVSAQISGLTGETGYRFRLVAENQDGKGNTEALQATFTTSPPLSIDSVYASAVSATAARVGARIDPIGTASAYRFEYLTEAAYQENVAAGLDPFGGAQDAPSPDGLLGPAEEDLSVSEGLSGLLPGTTYRYRVAAANSGGSRSSAAFSFTTQVPGPLSLLDERGWELVSPAEKHGALFKPIAEAGVVQAAADGGAITYLASNPTEASPQGYANQVQVLSARGASGWTSSDLSLPNRSATGLSIGVGQEYRSFSEDLSRGIAQPFLAADLAAISPLASEVTPFLRTNFPTAGTGAFCEGGCYRALVTGAEGVADVPPGTKIDPEPLCKGLCGPLFRDATPSLEDVLLESKGGLTEVPGDEGGLYEWSSTAPPTQALQLVSVLPSGKPAQRIGGDFGFQVAVERNAISEDGSRVIWGQARGHLYRRDVAAGETVQLDANQGGTGAGPAGAVFQGASPDGSRVFFTDQQALVAGAGAESNRPDLYECRFEASAGAPGCALRDLTPRTGGESADVQGLVSGIAQDGGAVYFVADGVLAENPGADGTHAAPGTCGTIEAEAPDSTCNLYLSRGGSLRFVARLSAEDSPDWGVHLATQSAGELPGLSARVSPDGEWFAFMSRRALGGYDNRDVASGEADEEVFLYHAATGSLICASCNPTGARPRGVEYARIDASTGHLAGGDRVWPATTWLAANIPGWTPYSSGLALHQARYLSDQGRLFFNSSDSLAPRDTNEREDVYEYEPPGGEGGDSCSPGDPTFSPAAQGCVDLISGGTSGEESAFLDASESGGDVFFLTAARLAPRDEDDALDVYDARIGGGEPRPTQPVRCEGDGCQQPASPPLDTTPGSLSFQGPGNVKECPKGKLVKNGRCVTPKPRKKHHKKKNAHKQHKKTKRATTNRAGAK